MPTTAADPFVLGRNIYPVKEAGYIAIPFAHPQTACYTDITIARNNNGYSIGAGDAVDVGAYGGIVDVCVAADASSGRQSLLFVRSVRKRLKLSEYSRATATNAIAARGMPLPSVASAKIIGFSPTAQSGSRTVLVAGCLDGRCSVWSCDLRSRRSTGRRDVPSSAAMSPVAAALIRRKTEAFVVLLSLDSGGAAANRGLVATVFPVTALDGGVGELAASQVTSIRLADNVDAQSVQAVVLRVDTASSDQQLAVCYACPPVPGPGGALTTELAVLGFDQKDAFAKLRSTRVNTDWAPPTRTTFRLAAADLNGDSADEIVVAWPGTYGGVVDCAAMALFAAGPDGGLTQTSTYVASTDDDRPLASVDLWIAAGVFGKEATTLGVLLISAGASLNDLQLGQAQVLSAVIGTDQGRLPSYGKQPRAPLGLAQLGSIPSDAPGIYGFAADLTGLSVVLGPGKLTTVTANRQFIAIFRAPPFDESVPGARPVVHFTETDHTVEGLHLATNKMWTTSKDFAASLGIASSTLTRHINETYGEHLDKLQDKSPSFGVTIGTGISQVDMVLTMAKDYSVWEYPVLRSSVADKPGGTVLVIAPSVQQPHQFLTAATDPDFGYRPTHEIGCLPSYVDMKPDGFAEANLLFAPITIEVTEDPNGSTCTFDHSNSRTETEGKGITLHNTLSDSAHLAASTNLFGYLPLQFGLNVTSSSTYSEGDVQTSTMTRTKTLTLSLLSGNVDDESRRYHVTTYVYHHAVLGCLCIGYEVSLPKQGGGPGWKQRYGRPTPMLIKPFRKTQDKIEGAFSRAVSFRANGQRVTIVVDIFNCSFGDQPMTLDCECYRGKPTLPDPAGKPVPSGDLIQKKAGITINNPLERRTVALDWPDAKHGECVTVKLIRTDPPTPASVYEIGWNVYPESEYAKQP